MNPEHIHIDVTECECDAFEVCYDANNRCVKCGKLRPVFAVPEPDCICPMCYGTGFRGANHDLCGVCNGRGYLW